MPSPKPYPAPLVTPPLRNDHTHTLILLHGRGSNSDRFGSIFLESTQIAQRLPTVKFIFPTAKKRRSMVLKRTPIHQWFDNYSLDDPNMRTDLQVDGLGESSRFLRTLIDDEARLFRTANDIPIPAGEEYSRIVIGGLSQGCALSVFCLLGGFPREHDELHKRLGGFVGMSGWLPFEKEITGLLKSDGDNESDDDPFSRDDESEEIPAPIQALNHARDILDLSPLQEESGLEDVVHLRTPIFLGHGSADPKVSVDLGQRMASILSDDFEMDITWKVYKDFGHWYKVPDEIDDVIDFLHKKVGVPSVD